MTKISGQDYFHVLVFTFYLGDGRILSNVFFLFSKIFISVKELHIGDQFSDSSKSWIYAQFQCLICVVTVPFCTIWCMNFKLVDQNGIMEKAVWKPAFSLLCSLKFFLLMDCALNLLSGYFEQSLGNLILKTYNLKRRRTWKFNSWYV